MAQATSITLADGQATPANVTFVPERVTPDLSTFVDRSSGQSISYRRLSVKFSPVLTNRSYTKTTFGVSLPVYGTLPSGASGVLRTLRATVELQLPDSCTDAERKDLFAFVENGLANSLIKGSMRDYDPLY